MRGVRIFKYQPHPLVALVEGSVMMPMLRKRDYFPPCLKLDGGMWQLVRSTCSFLDEVLSPATSRHPQEITTLACPLGRTRGGPGRSRTLKKRAATSCPRPLFSARPPLVAGHIWTFGAFAGAEAQQLALPDRSDLAKMEMLETEDM